MLKFVVRLGLLILVVVAIWFVRLLIVAGETRKLERVFAGECTQVPGVVGAEDIVIDRASKTALISSYDRRAAERGEAVRGAIYGYDLATRVLSKLPDGLSGGFLPHGLGLYALPGGVRLFVVNHDAGAAGEHSVEIFSFERGRLEHLETVQGDLLASPNDVVPVGRRSFYATNDHGSPDGLWRFLEEYLQLSKSNVVYYDGEDLSVAAEGIAYANGINLSAFGRELYVASSTKNALHMYARDPESASLTRTGTLDLGTGPDNIHVDQHGMLWIAAHPKLLTFASHARDAEKLSPSHVIWVDPDQNYDPPIRDVYIDLGKELSGSSVAVPWGSRVLIGSVFDDHFLDCERGTG